ncbi:MAG: ABC transporter permease [Verrucomicrobiae bacterium]|nr:ABC transporter permease [Verrucomicrobiae bacterium]
MSEGGSGPVPGLGDRRAPSVAHRRGGGLALVWAEAREGVAMALGAIAAHKLRSGLTLLGVLVGVFSIVVVMTALRVLQGTFETQLSALGAHSFSIQRLPPVRVETVPGGDERYARREPLRYSLAVAFERRATLARHVGVSVGMGSGIVTGPERATDRTIPWVGVSPGAFETRNWVVEAGRPIVADDVEYARRVCVLGASVADRLFPFGDAVGQRVRAGGIAYRVVGVTEPRGQLFGQDQDAQLLVPVTTALQRTRPDAPVDIQVQAWSAGSYEDTLEQARGILRVLRKVPPGEDDDFEIVSNDSIVRQFRALTLAVRTGAGLISSIALLAAGIGIMNIMLVSVTERTREIGLRRAIGAKRRHILLQFLLEAIVLCQIGGAAGLGLGILAGNGAALFLELPPAIPWDWAGLSVMICSFVGLAFGTYPAWKAAHLDPIESLRYE